MSKCDIVRAIVVLVDYFEKFWLVQWCVKVDAYLACILFFEYVENCLGTKL